MKLSRLKELASKYEPLLRNKLDRDVISPIEAIKILAVSFFMNNSVGTEVEEVREFVFKLNIDAADFEQD